MLVPCRSKGAGRPQYASRGALVETCRFSAMKRPGTQLGRHHTPIFNKPGHKRPKHLATLQAGTSEEPFTDIHPVLRAACVVIH